jgi:hypothetical protein
MAIENMREWRLRTGARLRAWFGRPAQA